ncbi:hypothetical protein EAG_13343 [Camponotus floridanus]|uniref:Uncharacterized protein n=1 Tax=Camponotus floridanus TaxID=104421 RepID=E2A5N9_CAMFO|nr:hypothetical protein EAG_13343 [Camponotus floridanus]
MESFKGGQFAWFTIAKSGDRGRLCQQTRGRNSFRVNGYPRDRRGRSSKGGSETKEEGIVARSVLSLPVELYLHGVTCPINREHYSPVDGLRIRDGARITPGYIYTRVRKYSSGTQEKQSCEDFQNFIPFGTALGLARSRLHANPKSTALCWMSSAPAAAETQPGIRIARGRDFNPRYIPRRNIRAEDLGETTDIDSITYKDSQNADHNPAKAQRVGIERQERAVKGARMLPRGSEANVDDGESKRRAAQLASQQSTYEVGTLPDYIDSFASKIRAANCVYCKNKYYRSECRIVFHFIPRNENFIIIELSQFFPSHSYAIASKPRYEKLVDTSGLFPE